MAKKEKVPIQKDKRMEPIDNELDAAMGLLENANRQITDLLASFTPVEPGAGAELEEASADKEGEAKAEDASAVAEAVASQEPAAPKSEE